MKRLGDSYESKACAWLQARGVTIRQRNFRAATGEIDIVALDAGHLLFIEVRARNNQRFAGAAASVTPAKQRRIVRTALRYLQEHRDVAALPCRFDVVAFEPPQSAPGIRWIRGAFTA